MTLFEVKDNKIVLRSGANQLESIRKFFSSDNSKGHVFFYDAIAYIYWVHSPESICSNKYLEDRKKFVISNFLKNYKVETFDNNQYLQDVVKDFIELEMSLSEMFYEDLKRDMYDMLLYLRSIPWTKKQKVNKEIEVYIGGEPHKVMVDTIIDIDNSDEKVAAIAKSEKIIDLEKKLKEKIAIENKEGKKTQRRLFENS